MGKWNKSYPSGIPLEIEESNISIYDILAISTAKSPHMKAIIDENIEMSYSEVKSASDNLALYFYNKGFRKGDRVVVMLPNSLEYIVCYFAVQRLGCTIVQVNILYQSSELTHIMSDSDAHWVVCAENQIQKLNNLKLSNEIEIISFDEKRDLFNSICLESEGNTSLSLPQIEIYPKEDVAILQYTGGTTGNPKGAMLTHFNIVSNAIQNCTFYSILENGEIVLGNSPMSHVMGLSYINITFISGGTYVVVRRYSVLKAKELLKKHSPTIFVGAPTMYIGLLNSKEIEDADLQSLKVCTCGTAPLPIEVIKEFERRSGSFILEGYGMTEALVTHRNPKSKKKKTGSIGIPLPSTECKVVDLEDGETEVPVGAEGELMMKGPQIMKGYWRNSNATEEVLRNGWLYTGDIAVMDEEGFFYIVGRKKELIIASGYNIYPIEVENTIYQHPAVLEACVYGLPDSYRGETVKCVVVLKEGFTLTEEELIAFCKDKLATYKVPRLIEFRDSLPKTTVGKIMRRQLIKEEKQINK